MNHDLYVVLHCLEKGGETDTAKVKYPSAEDKKKNTTHGFSKMNDASPQMVETV